MADQTPTAPSRPAAPPLLDLDTLTSRPIVRIDGVEYEMRSPDECSILEFHRMQALGRRMEAIEVIDEPSDQQLAEYGELLDKQCRRLLLAPEAVQVRLKTAQRAAVIVAFTQLRQPTISGAPTVGARKGAPPPPVAPSDAPTTGAN